MHRVLVLGGGQIGTMISGLLGSHDDFQVHVADVNEAAVNAMVAAYDFPHLTGHALDAGNPAALAAHLEKHPADAVISSLPYFLNPGVAQIAREKGLHYFDLTEDVEVTRTIKSIADGADQAYAPQCGLAPGFISIVASELMTHFDELLDVKMRVGALPQNPNNALKYSLTWSTEGLINEYGNLCYGIENYETATLMPLEGLETIEIDGERYEAFNTSGGLGSLGDSWANKVRRINYKTMRYPGHCAQMRLLMNDLKLNEDRDTFKRILERSVPRTVQDVVIVYVSVTGKRGGTLIEENFVNKIYPRVIANELRSSIQITTAAGVCSVLDLVLSDPGRHRGFVKQEDFRLKDILNNRFGKDFGHGGSSLESARVVALGETQGHQ